MRKKLKIMILAICALLVLVPALHESPEEIIPIENFDSNEIEMNALLATVLVEAGWGTGSGTVIKCEETKNGWGVYILTAYHVISPGKGMSKWKDPSTVMILFYDENNFVSIVTKSHAVAANPEIDAAILYFEYDREIVNVARMPSRLEFEEVGLFNNIFVMGCALGIPPTYTNGRITSVNTMIEGGRYWMGNAPVIYGNSGGGIFLEEDGSIIGILCRVYSYAGGIAVSHLAVFMPMRTIYDWLDETKLSHLYPEELEIVASK